MLCDIYAFETRELLVTVERCMLWSWHDSTLMDRDGCGARVCVRIILFEILIQNARARESDYALWHRELIVNTWSESGRVRTFKFRVLALFGAVSLRRYPCAALTASTPVRLAVRLRRSRTRGVFELITKIRGVLESTPKVLGRLCEARTLGEVRQPNTEHLGGSPL